MRFALDVRKDDVYWNTADSGWAYGFLFAVVGPLLLGRSTILYDGPLDADRIYRILARYGVTNLAAAASWYNSLRISANNTDSTSKLKLRVASSAGEPLDAAVAAWTAGRLNVPLHDHYGQAELGMVIANHHAPALKRPLCPGSVGQAMSGFRVVILDVSGREVAAGVRGEIAVDTQNSPRFWFGGYFNDPASTAKRFRHGRRYYLTGDLARMDEDGNVYCLGPVEDRIISTGYAIGHSDIEVALTSHVAVAEAAMAKKSDKLRGEIVKVFIVLKKGFVPTLELASEIARLAKSRLANDAHSPDLEFVPRLPRALRPKQIANSKRGRPV
jgi:acetyl-CoA synthetase